jgi:hypothetical protein
MSESDIFFYKHRMKRAVTALRHRGSVSQLAIFIMLLMFLSGNYLYVESPSASFANVLSFLGIIPAAILFLSWRPRSAGWSTLIALVTLICLSLFVYTQNDDWQNVRLVRDMVVLSMGIFLGAASPRWFGSNTYIMVLLLLLFVTVIAVLQMSYLVFGVGLQPQIDQALAARSDLRGVQFGVPALFGNPNDLGTFAAATLLVLMRNERVALIAIPLIILCLLLSGTRAGIILVIIGMMLINRRLGIIVFLGALVVSSMLQTLAYMQITTQIYAIDRLISAYSLFAFSDLSYDTSISVRLSSLGWFFSNYPNFLFGDFDRSSAYTQFSGAPFDTSLIAVNPHNAVIELHCLFGILGLLPIALLLHSVWQKTSRGKQGVPFQIFGVFSMIALTSIGSSALSFHQLFFLFGIACALPRQPRS